jgi:hypothetical protein
MTKICRKFSCFLLLFSCNLCGTLFYLYFSHKSITKFHLISFNKYLCAKDVHK